MERHHLGTLSVTLRADPSDGLTAHQGRDFAMRAWEAAGDELARRNPGRIYRLHRWQGAWSVTPDQIRRRDTRQVIRQIVELCESLPLASPLHPPDRHAAGASFVDEACRVATWWSRGQGAHPASWAWDDLIRRGSPLAAMASLPPAERRRVIVQLDTSHLLEPALRPLSHLDRRRLVSLVADDPRRAAHRRRRGHHVPVSERPQGGERRQDDLASQHASSDVGSVADLLRTLVADALPGAESAHHPDPATGVQPDAARTARATSDTDHRGSDDDAVRAPDAPDRRRGGSVAVSSRWVGLAYLIRPMLRCGVGEALWMACLPEAAVIAAAWRSLAGDDPAVSILTGDDRGDPLPSMSAEHLVAVGDHVLPRLVSAFGHDADPASSTWLRTHGQTTTLHIDRSPWPCMAWHDTPFAACAAQVLAAGLPEPRLDHRTVWTPQGDDPITSAVLAVVVGAPATLLAASCDDAPSETRAFVERWYHIDGRVVDDGAAVRVEMPGKSIDLSLRRAGADADPGWVPWARRTVRIRFHVGELA